MHQYGNAFANPPDEQMRRQPPSTMTPAPVMHAAPSAVGPVGGGNAFARPVAAIAAPMAAQPQAQPQGGGNAFADGVKRFARGIIGGERADQIDAQRKAKAMEGIKVSRDFLAHAATLPEAQRAQFFATNADAIVAAGGRDPRQMAGQYDDATIKQGLAALSAQLGEGPEKKTYQLAQGPNGILDRFNPSTGEVQSIRGAVPEPTKPQDLPDGMWYGPDGKGPPQPIPGYVSMRTQIARGSQQQGANGRDPPSGYRWSQNGNLERIPGGPADKPAGPDYDAPTVRKFLTKAAALDAAEAALNKYEQLINKHGNIVLDKGWNGLGDDVRARELDSEGTVLRMQLKNAFELGAITGPDMGILLDMVPDATGRESFGKNSESMSASLSGLKSYIKAGRTQIPEEILAKARPNGVAPGAPVASRAPGGTVPNSPMLGNQKGWQPGIGAPIDRSRPILENNDGSFSTERTITVQGRDGQWYNLPTIINGKAYDPAQVQQAFEGGQNIPNVGVFKTLQQAEQAARARSSEIGRVREQDRDIHPDIASAIDQAFGPDDMDDEVPEGVDPDDWQYFTPEMKQQYLQGVQ